MSQIRYGVPSHNPTTRVTVSVIAGSGLHPVETNFLQGIEQGDTANASGKVRITGAVAATNANDTSSVSASVRQSGTVAKTNQDDTQSASASVKISGTVAKTEGADTSTISGNLSGIGHVASVTGSGEDDFNITIPSTVVAGDILVLDTFGRGFANDFNISDNDTGGNSWTNKHSRSVTISGTDGNQVLYWKRATSGTASKSVTIGFPLNVDTCAAILSVYRGCHDSGDPIEAILSEANASGNETQAQITTLTPKAMVVLAVGAAGSLNSVQAATDPSTLVEKADINPGGLIEPTSISHASAAKSAAGGTGAFTWNLATNVDGTSIAYALKAKLTITGTLVRTNANDTSTAAGTRGTVSSGTLAKAETVDASSITGKVTVKGTLARTNANDTGDLTNITDKFRTASGKFNWSSSDGLNTTYTISGLTFQPKAVILFTSGAIDGSSGAGVHFLSFGFFTSVSARRAYSTVSFHNQAAALSGGGRYNNAVVVFHTTTGTIDGALDVDAVLADGFRIIVDNALSGGGSADIFWLALGGPQLTDAEILDFTAPGSTGNQDYTTSFALNTGKDDKAVILVSGAFATINNVQSWSELMIGVAAGDAISQGVMYGTNEDQSDPTVTWSYCRAGEVFASSGAASDNVANRASLTTWLSNGFRLNWAEVTNGNQPPGSALVLKGGRYTVGDLVASATAGNQVTENTTYKPKALLFLSHAKAASTINARDQIDERSIGVATGATQRFSAYVRDDDNVGTTVVGRGASDTAIFAELDSTSSKQERAFVDMVSINDSPPGFTVETEDGPSAEAITAPFIAYLNFAEDIANFLAKTNQNDTSNASGTVKISGSMARTNSADTSNVTAKIRATGTLARTNAADTSNATAKTRSVGTLVRTNINDAIEASQQQVSSGFIDKSEGADSSNASGKVDIDGSASSVNSDDASNVTAKLRTLATVARAEQSDGLEALGQIIAAYGFEGRVRWAGTVSRTETGDTANVSGIVILDSTGTAASTNSDDTSNVSAKVRIVGTQGQSENSDTANADGRIRNRATVAPTETADTSQTTGTVDIAGTLARSNGSDSSNVSAEVRILATLARTDGADTQNATAKIQATGTLSKSNDHDANSVTGRVRFVAILGQTNGDDTSNASALVRVIATLARTEIVDTPTITAKIQAYGVLARTNDADTMSADATNEARGTVAVTSNADHLTTTAVVRVIGTQAYAETVDTSQVTAKIQGSGFLQQAEGADTSDVPTKVRVIGSLARGNGSDTSDFTASLRVIGSLARTNTEDNHLITGRVRWAATLSRTENVDNRSITAILRSVGTLAGQENRDTCIAISNPVGNMDQSESRDTSYVTTSLRSIGTLVEVNVDDSPVFTARIRAEGGLVLFDTGYDTAQVVCKIIARGILAETGLEDESDVDAHVRWVATASGQEDVDTSLVTSVVRVVGTGIPVGEADTSNVTAKGVIRGTQARLETGDILFTIGKIPVVGSFTYTNAHDLPAFVARIRAEGWIVRDEGRDSLDATALLFVSGTVSVTEERDAGSVSAVVRSIGSLARVAANDTANVSAFVNLDTTGSVNTTEQSDDHAISAKIRGTGTLARIGIADTANVVAHSRHVGTLARVAANDQSVFTAHARWIATLDRSAANDFAVNAGRVFHNGVAHMMEHKDYSIPDSPEAGGTNTKKGPTSRRVAINDRYARRK